MTTSRVTHRFRRPKGDGFTLIEIVVLIAIIGIAAGGLMNLYGAIGRQSLSVDDRQRGLLLVEACAEVLVASRQLISSTVTGTIADASCSAAPASSPVCECHYLTPAAGSAFGALKPRVTVVHRAGPGVTTFTGTNAETSLCYADAGCVQVTVEALSGASALFDPVFLQLQDF